MRSIPLALMIAAGAAAAGACGSSSQSVTSPSTAKCAVTASVEPANFASGGGSGTLTVKTNRECNWTGSSQSDWIKLGSSSGQGDASIRFTVAANVEPDTRRGAIAIGDEQVAISQDAARCTFTVSPSSDFAAPAGERRRLEVTASSQKCTWSARSNTEWLTIVEGSQGSGNGQVVYDVRATDGPERSGTLTVAGQTVRVTQGVGCRSSVSSTRVSVAAAAGAGAVQVATGAGCPWTATSQTTWITLTTPGNASGPGEVRFSAAANTGPERQGTLTVAEQAVNVVQANGCAYALSASSALFGIAASAGSVQVTTAAACTWTASSNAAWVTLTAGGNGSGPGEVRFAVAANAGPQRTATLSIAGESYTVTQASGCTYTIDAASFTLQHEGDTRSVQVTTTAGCPWSAASNVDWISIASGASSAGPGAAQLAIQTNHGPERVGTAVVAGSTVTVTQGSGCDVLLSPTSFSFGPGAQTGSVRVMPTSGGCQWTAESNAPWIAITAGADGSSGEVQFTVQPNTGPERSGTLRIGGRFVSITQAAGS